MSSGWRKWICFQTKRGVLFVRGKHLNVNTTHERSSKKTKVIGSSEGELLKIRIMEWVVYRWWNITQLCGDYKIYNKPWNMNPYKPIRFEYSETYFLIPKPSDEVLADFFWNVHFSCLLVPLGILNLALSTMNDVVCLCFWGGRSIKFPWHTMSGLAKNSHWSPLVGRL